MTALNSESFVIEENILRFTFSLDTPEPVFTSYTWNILPNGIFPARSSDFEIMTGMIIFAPGQTEKTITIATNVHTDGTIDRSFVLEISSHNHDPYGDYNPDPYGDYNPDHYGHYNPDPYGDYNPDHYGHYNPDPYGHYSHDPYGDYSHDPFGDRTITYQWFVVDGADISATTVPPHMTFTEFTEFGFDSPYLPSLPNSHFGEGFGDGHQTTEPNEPGEGITDDDDSSVVTDEGDGEVVTNDDDGSVVTDEGDGEVVTNDDEGSVVTDEGDGEVVTDDDEGSVVTDEGDGEVVTDDDESVTVTDDVVTDDDTAVTNVDEGTKNVYRFSSDGGTWAGVDGDVTIHNFERGVDKLLFVDIDDDSPVDLNTFIRFDSQIEVKLISHGQNSIINLLGIEIRFSGPENGGASSENRLTIYFRDEINIYDYGNINDEGVKLVGIGYSALDKGKLADLSLLPNYFKAADEGFDDGLQVIELSEFLALITDVDDGDAITDVGDGTAVTDDDDGVAITDVDLDAYTVVRDGDGNGADRVSGTSADEIIQGGNKADIITTSGGDDIVLSGYGRDKITLSDDGAETIIYRFSSNGADGWTAIDGADRVHNFKRGVDKLVFVDVDTDTPVDLAGFLAGIGAGIGSFSVRPNINGNVLTGVVFQFIERGFTDGPGTGDGITDSGRWFGIYYAEEDWVTVYNDDGSTTDEGAKFLGEDGAHYLSDGVRSSDRVLTDLSLLANYFGEGFQVISPEEIGVDITDEVVTDDDEDSVVTDEVVTDDDQSVAVTDDDEGSVVTDEGDGEVVTDDDEDSVVTDEGDDEVVTDDDEGSFVTDDGDDEVVTDDDEDSVVTDEVVTDDDQSVAVTDDDEGSVVTDEGDGEVVTDDDEDFVVTDEGDDEVVTDDDEGSFVTDDGDDEVVTDDDEDSVVTDDGDDEVVTDDDDDEVVTDDDEDPVVTDEGDDEVVTDDDESVAVIDDDEDPVVTDDGDGEVVTDDDESVAVIDDDEDPVVTDEGDGEVVTDDDESVAVIDDDEDPVVTDEGDGEVVTDDDEDPVVTDEGDDEVVTDDDEDPVVTDEGDGEVVTDDDEDPVVTDEGDDEVVTDDDEDPVVTDEGDGEVVTDDDEDPVVTDDDEGEVVTDDDEGDITYVIADPSAYAVVQNGDGNGNDRLTGTSADEIIQGGNKDDLITVGGGNDIIIGGYGSDTIFLGDGGETIVYRFSSDGDWTAIDGSDTIHNFDRDIDKLVLVDMGATPTNFDSFKTSSNVNIRPFFENHQLAGITIEFNGDGFEDGIGEGASSGNTLTIHFGKSIIGKFQVISPEELGVLITDGDDGDADFVVTSSDDINAVSAGDVLSVALGTSDPDGDGIFTYQWKRGGGDIVGATSAAYVVTAADQGRALTVTVSYTDGGGTDEHVTSDAIDIPAASASTDQVSFVIASDGNVEAPFVGDLLSATQNAVDPQGDGTFSYQWFVVGGADIVGATDQTYTITEADQIIAVRASYTDGSGNDETVTAQLSVASIIPIVDPSAYAVVQDGDGSGNDILIGTSADELFQGGNRYDRITTGGGNDIVIGGYGPDTIILGEGAETIIYRFSSDGTDGWTAIDGRDAIFNFDRGTDKLVLVDVGGTPINDENFIASDSNVKVLLIVDSWTNHLSGMRIMFEGGGLENEGGAYSSTASVLTINWHKSDHISLDDTAYTGKGLSAIAFADTHDLELTDLSLLPNYFEASGVDFDDGFQIIEPNQLGVDIV